MEEKNRLINEACKIFKQEAHSNFKKFKFLAEWVNSEAKYFNDDRINFNRNHKVYQRGALVMVDFGVNVGNELSGNHFAVVLNKNDSPKNGVLTVAPITSKGNKFTVQIDGLISDKSHKILESEFHESAVNHYFMQKRIVKDGLTDEEKAFIEEEYNTEGRLIAQYSKYITSEEYIIFYETNLTKVKCLLELFEHYMKYNKISHAKILDIKTISKKRIKFLNEYDPCGRIKVSNETLDKIDDGIKKNFLNS
ncbi:type II toxin-antitoxin system PemK/MazF family toxin [Aerococcaceae bacterium zg-ZUI334]|uniref:type II toxin-antitoxin system PemK/MazF family toxin n=1 Tax=Aerococcaceae bacterium zg-252 TaxID=2796928 RepID=UPI001B9E8C99|nr:type II toxin-antitoxin system PemK/MazF family toxin [Aerococcaceae bacterium zg-ZUI334]